MEWLTLVAGLFSGMVGGLLAAGPIAYRGEAARERFRAEASIRSALTEYRDAFRYDHDHKFTAASMPNSYLEVAGRGALAARVLAEVDKTAPYAREALLENLEALVGQAAFRWAMDYRFAPEHMKGDGNALAQSVLRHRHAGADEGLLYPVRYPPEGETQERAYAVAMGQLEAMILSVSPQKGALSRVWDALRDGSGARRG